MTFAELLDLARARIAAERTQQNTMTVFEDKVCRGILDLLGGTLECGWVPPCIEDPGIVAIMDGSHDPQPAYEFTTSEGRAFAATILHACDERDRLDAEQADEWIDKAAADESEKR